MARAEAKESKYTVTICKGHETLVFENCLKVYSCEDKRLSFVDRNGKRIFTTLPFIVEEE